MACDRRRFLSVAALALSSLGPGALGADRKRIGVLMGISDRDPEARRRAEALRQGLEKLGWKDGRDIEIDYRVTAGSAERAARYAEELVKSNPAVLVATATAPTAALQRATRTIPIVFAQVIDPVAAGFVAEVSRPGGNLTGFTSFEPAMSAQWVEMLREIVPRLENLALVADPRSTGSAPRLAEITRKADALGLKTHIVDVKRGSDVEPHIAEAAARPNSGAVVLPGPHTASNRGDIVRAANRSRLPAIYPYRYFAESGGLVSFGVDTGHGYRVGVASYVDRILRGEKVGELPVMPATRYEIVLNLRTAKEIGVRIPDSLRKRVDEVIE